MIKPASTVAQPTNIRKQILTQLGDESVPDSIQERIKIGQELNKNRPNESKGHRQSGVSGGNSI